MALITPSRLQALTVLAGMVALGVMSGASCDAMQWADADSVPRLSDARACELAIASTPEYERGPCKVLRFDEHSGVVQVGRNSVCFLRAARWFVVLPDGVSPDDCPPGALGDMDDVSSRAKELKLETEWATTARLARDSQLNAFFRASVRGVANAWRNSKTPAPPVCPELMDSQVEAIDMNLALPGGRTAAWHYLTSDRVGIALNADQWGAAYDVRVLRRDVEYFLLVDAPERRQPQRDEPGFVSGRVALVDWKKQRVLCETDFELEQDPVHSKREADSPSPYMQSFKEQVSALLAEKVAVLSNQRLKLEQTW